MATQTPIGRDDELGSIQAFLERAAQGPAALVFSGEPGIGKSILWEGGLEEAWQRFGRVLSCRGVEAEASFSFAALSDLVTPVLEEVSPSLLPLRREALEVALLLAKPGETAPDARIIGLAFLDVLRLLSEQSPIVVAVDDLQWLDASSLAVLRIALRRLQEEPVGVLATVRDSPGAGYELERCFDEGRLQQVAVRPLTLGSLHHLIKERLALELTRPELARVHETSSGNPFFALELARELIRTNSRPGAGRALRVPKSLHELLGVRLALLPAQTMDVLLFAAALARPTTELVAEADGRPEAVIAALDAASRQGVVELDESRIRFAHPLLASICYEQAQPWKRRAVHRVLADAVGDVEERARHLALAAAGPDAAVASELDAAAEQAAARGATAAAAELGELAAELTPPDDPALVRQRWFRSANFYRLAGGVERSVSILEQLLSEVPSGVERADLLFALASAQRADSETTIELCDQALSEATGDDVRLARILGYRSWTRLFQADVHGALADARAAFEKAEHVGDPTLIAVAIGELATAEGRAGTATPGLLERGVEIEERFGLRLEYHESPSVALSRRLVGLGELDKARTILRRIESNAVASGDELLRGQATGSLCRLEWFAGRWQVALDNAAVADEVRQLTAARHELGVSSRLRALVQADLGLVEQARASAEEALASSRAMADEEWTILTLGVLGRLELMVGNLDAAAGYLRELPGRLLSAGYNDPTAPLWADAIETLIALGELDQAREYLVAWEEHGQRLGSPWALAGAARCRGLLTAAEGNPGVAFEAFERSLAALQRYSFPFERARTLLCLGIVRRQGQQRTAAREAFEEALTIFAELGALLWAEKARAELRRISGRRPASDELTETEHRVAVLAAHGRSNKEIAAELFMGVSTVEAHLSRVYRKVGVRSRTELGSRLVPPGSEAPNAVDEAAQV